MAGHIKRRTIASNLDKVGETTLLEKIASGMTMAGLARDLGISNLSLYNWIRKEPDREERFRQARIIAADKWADDCLEIADAADHVSANADRLKIETRKWLAGVTNPERFQAKPTTAVQVNVAQLHLDALRQLNLADNSVHDNSVHDNSVHDNSVHDNSVHDNSVPDNSVPDNSVHNHEDTTPSIEEPIIQIKQVGSHNLDADDLPDPDDDDFDL